MLKEDRYMNNSKVIELKKINFTIPEVDLHILHDINLEVFSDDFIILLGNNGCGKSSLIKIIDGTYKPESGEIIRHGKDFKDSSIVTVMQNVDNSLFPGMTVFENCMLWKLREDKVSLSFSKADDKNYYKSYLAPFNENLPDKIDTTVRRLSGGEKQSLILALCLCCPPKLLLLDEHTSALDPKMTDIVMDMTNIDILREKVPCMMTTHNLSHAIKYGNRIIMMRNGRIVHDFRREEKENIDISQLKDMYI